MPVNWMPQSLPQTSQRDVTPASFLRANGFLLGLAALKLLLHLPVLHRYGLELENVNPCDTPFVVSVCRKPKLTVEELWPQLRPG